MVAPLSDADQLRTVRPYFVHETGRYFIHGNHEHIQGTVMLLRYI